MPAKKVTKKRKNSKAVQKLQKHEKKYTVFVVAFFLALFFFFGYMMFIVPNRSLSRIQRVSTSLTDTDNEEEGYTIDSVSTYSEIITLTEEHIMGDEAGMVSTPHLVSIKNPTADDIHYRILLKNDDVLQQRCGCKNKYSSNIMIGVEGQKKNLSSLEKFVVYEGDLKALEEKELSFHLWFNNDTPRGEEVHFHGQFELVF